MAPPTLQTLTLPSMRCNHLTHIQLGTEGGSSFFLCRTTKLESLRCNGPSFQTGGSASLQFTQGTLSCPIRMQRAFILCRAADMTTSSFCSTLIKLTFAPRVTRPHTDMIRMEKSLVGFMFLVLDFPVSEGVTPDRCLCCSSCCHTADAWAPGFAV